MAISVWRDVSAFADTRQSALMRHFLLLLDAQKQRILLHNIRLSAVRKTFYLVPINVIRFYRTARVKRLSWFPPPRGCKRARRTDFPAQSRKSLRVPYAFTSHHSGVESTAFKTAGCGEFVPQEEKEKTTFHAPVWTSGCVCATSPCPNQHSHL